MAKNERKGTVGPGVGQLTLVETALCPLDKRHSLKEQLVHSATLDYSAEGGKRRQGSVRVICPLGLSANDEFFLWGLLALSRANGNSSGRLHATRHYILRQLGVVDTGSRRGGSQYALFTKAIERLSCVQYISDCFYDPVRQEHRRVSFGFFSYSRPLSDESSRLWRFTWDAAFFEFVAVTGGKLRFHLDIYADLDPASRRLYLFLTKLFWRRERTHAIRLDRLSVDVMGYSPTLSINKRKQRVEQSIVRLVERGVVQAKEPSIRKLAVGKYVVVLRKGPAYKKKWQDRVSIESPLVEPMAELGLEPAAINWILKTYDTRLVGEWVDITIAAREDYGMEFFSRSPAAYLRDNLKHAADGRRTPPDWWLELRRGEERNRGKRDRQRRANGSTDSADMQALETIGDVTKNIFSHFVAAGQSETDARRNAARLKKRLQRG